MAELSIQCTEKPLKVRILNVGQNTFRHLQLNIFAHYKLVYCISYPKGKNNIEVETINNEVIIGEMLIFIENLFRSEFEEGLKILGVG